MGWNCPNTSGRATGHVEKGCRRRSLIRVGGRPGHGVQFVEVGRWLGEAGLLLQVRWAANSGHEIVPLLAQSRATTGFTRTPPRLGVWRYPAEPATLVGKGSLGGLDRIESLLLNIHLVEELCVQTDRLRRARRR